MAGLSEKEQKIWNAYVAEFSNRKQSPSNAALCKADHQFNFRWRHDKNPSLTEADSERLVADLRSNNVQPPAPDVVRRTRRRLPPPSSVPPTPPIWPEANALSHLLPSPLPLGAFVRGGAPHMPAEAEVTRHRSRSRLFEGRWRRWVAWAGVGAAALSLVGLMARRGYGPSAGFDHAQQVVLANPSYLGRLGLCKDLLTKAANSEYARGNRDKAAQLSLAADHVSPDAPCALPADSDGSVRLATGPGTETSIHGSDLVGGLAPTAHPTPSLPPSLRPSLVISPSPTLS